MKILVRAYDYPNDQSHCDSHHSEVGINLYTAPVGNAVSSKIVDYLICGLKVVSEAPAPNNHWLCLSKGSEVCEWNNPEKMSEAIHRAIKAPIEKERTAELAQKVFDTKSSCQRILECL